jgi:hypothetical protein
MRTNPFYDAWIFLTGQTDEHAASGIGWLLTGLFIALLLASVNTAGMSAAGGSGNAVVEEGFGFCAGFRTPATTI